MSLAAGIGGGRTHGSVALTSSGRIVAACDQARVTRVPGAGLNAAGMPDEALDVLLEGLEQPRSAIGRVIWAGAEAAQGESIDTHLAYASAAYRSSPFHAALVVVCDTSAPKLSVWRGDGASVTPLDCRWTGPGFTDAYTGAARAFGFGHAGAEQHFEALARLRPGFRDTQVDALFSRDGLSLTCHPNLAGEIAARLPGDQAVGGPASAGIASAVQARLEELFVELLNELHLLVPFDEICLGGSLFRQSSMNTAVRKSGIFRDVFVPADSGTGSLAVGAALHAGGLAPQTVSAFLGPAYSAEETKRTLDNCKARYSWESDDDATALAVQALKRGQMVGWFDGALEWGHRALGARSIVASPLSPFVLENLNVYLKRREPWRGYALSILEPSVSRYLDGPPTARHMEYEYRPLDPGTLRHVLPREEAGVRVHTVGSGAQPRFRRLLEAFEQATGIPFLVNTSFNAFREPIVCTPRDALRAFYGSGLDLLVMDRFVLGK